MITALVLAVFFGPQAPVLPAPPQARGRIAGRVMAGGAPAAGTRVGILEVRSDRGEPALMGVAQTSSDGRYQLEDLAPGRYYLIAGPLDLPTYYPGETALAKATIVTVSAGAALLNVDFTLAPATVGFKVSGRIVWHVERPVPLPLRSGGNPNPRVMLIDVTGIPLIVRTGIEGEFEFEHIRPGTYELRAEAEREGAIHPVVVVADRDVTGVEMVIPRSVGVTGLVLTEDGSAVPSMAISFVAENAHRQEDVVSGKFLALLPEGLYRVRATGLAENYYLKSLVAGSTDLLQEPLAVVEAGIRITAVVARGGPVRVSGRIAGKSGVLPARIELRETPLNPEGIRGLRQDSVGMGERVAGDTVILDDGTFQMDRVALGRYSVVLVLDSGVRIPAGTVVVPEKGAAGLEIAAPEIVEISGRVLVEENAPLPRFTLVVSNGDVKDPVTGLSALRAVKDPLPGFPVLRVGSAGAGRPSQGPTLLQVTPLPDGSFRFHLPEGVFSIVLLSTLFSGEPQPYELKGMTRGKIDLLTEPLIVEAGKAESGKVEDGKVGDGIDDELRLTFGLRTRPFRVAGRVTGLDSPVRDARIRLNSSAVVSFEAPLSPDGSFEFLRVPSGSYAPHVVPAQAFDPEIPFMVRGADLTNLIVEIPRTRRVRGRVRVEGTGPPIGFSLELGRGVATSVSVNPGLDGAFEADVPEGRHEVPANVLALGYRLNPFVIDTSRSDEVLVTLSLADKPLTFKLAGRLTDAGADGARVKLVGLAMGATFEAPVENSAFAFPALLPDVYSVTVIRDGRPLAVEPRFAAVMTKDADIEFRPAQTLSGAVIGGPEPRPTGVQAVEPNGSILTVGGRGAENESIAVANLRTINTAEVTYLSSTGGNYGSIPQMLAAGLLDTRFRDGISGYRFSLAVTGGDYWVAATPITPQAGKHAFFSTPDGVVRFAMDPQFAASGSAGRPVP